MPGVQFKFVVVNVIILTNNKKNLENNKKIRKDALNFIKKNRGFFDSELGKRNVNNLIWQVSFILL